MKFCLDLLTDPDEITLIPTIRVAHRNGSMMNIETEDVFDIQGWVLSISFLFWTASFHFITRK